MLIPVRHTSCRACCSWPASSPPAAPAARSSRRPGRPSPTSSSSSAAPRRSPSEEVADGRASTSASSSTPTRRARTAPTPSSASATPISAKARPSRYVLAINEFREFLTFFPTHARADYAQYKLGDGALPADAQRRARSDRDARGDQGVRRLRRALPEQRADGRGQGEAARGAGPPERSPNTRSGYFYYRSRWYPGRDRPASSAARRTTRSSPAATRSTSTSASRYAKVGQPAEALPYFERLVAEFEQSEHLVEAQKRSRVVLKPAAKTADDQAQDRSPLSARALRRGVCVGDAVEAPVVVDAPTRARRPRPPTARSGRCTKKHLQVIVARG